MSPQVPACSKLIAVAKGPWTVACNFSVADLRGRTVNLVSDFYQEGIGPWAGALVSG